MHAPPGFIDSVEATKGHGIDARHVVAVVGKVFSGLEFWGGAYDAIAFDDQGATVAMFYDPFSPEQGDGVVGGVSYADEVHKGVRLVLGQAESSMVVAELIEAGLKAG